ncbi:phytanoyl-CoA dioxygenase [Scytonema hofmannii PCC 7110]|uniref:Phytanoyl-CoA dioxygenase n=1 Tax=Scytonema hofmannii PCC 7110 TaxID=128403 RepID=A0A139XDN1_9CYAN|nr:phytanoyl-CoA dioxygenase family protein [Scytonema hofmannii]KYC42763.1 phytanoyl-CoA dioxygenase [Scytonema hofmannii PCC 7110]
MISSIGNIIKSKVIDLQSQLIYRGELLKHAGKVPVLKDSDRKIVDALNTEGVYVTSLEELKISSTSTLLKTAHNYLSEMLSVNHSEKTERLPQIYTMTDLSEFSQWAQEKKLLSIIENYIGLPVAFHGVHLRKDFPNENQFGTLLWHKDSEDRRIVKIIVYLSDVEDRHGPFEYIPLSLTSLPNLNYYRIYYKLWRSGYIGINDEQLQDIIPKKYWKSCPGPAGTVIFVDPRRALHHGTLRTQDRSALFFVYTANPPQRPELCTQYWDETFARPEVLCKA